MSLQAGAADWTFDGCTFQHLGGSGLGLAAGTRDITVSRSSFHDISASAIIIGGVEDWAETATSKQTSGNKVADCTIGASIGMEYHGSPAILALVTAGTTLEHNRIFEVSYTALSIGWGWPGTIGRHGYSRGATVAGNAVSRNCKTLFDCGVLYTLGASPGSTATANYFSAQYHDAVIYHDEGSAGWRDTGNVVAAIPPVTSLCISAWMLSTPGCEGIAPPNLWLSMWTPTIHDVVVANNWLDSSATCSIVHPTNSTVTNNTVVKSGEGWPAQAARIISQAGPRKRAALKADDAQAGTAQHPITPDYSIRTVHIVSQCHLDAGYKYPYVAEVASEWFEKWIPQSIALSEKLRNAGGQVQHRWTMNPWFASFFLSCPTHRAVWEERNEFTVTGARPSFQLQCPNASAIAVFKAAVQRGDINFYASGFCTMYEYADDSLLSWISEFTHSVGTMAGQPFRSTVASQRDEPGITRSAIPLLVDKGVTGYVAGVDWASPVAAVPRAFVWRDEASGKELLMAW